MRAARGAVATRPGGMTLGAVGLVSAAGLAWEITLTRLASVILSYHYAFVAVSLAIVGLGLGAALVYAQPDARARRMALPGAAAAAGAFLLVALLTPLVATQGSLAGLVAVALLPFLALGVMLATAFRAYAAASAWLYGADLAGAGAGTVAAVAGLNLVGPFGVLFALGLLSAAAGLLLALDRWPCPAPAPAGLDRAYRSLLVLLLCGPAVGLVVQATRAPLGIDYAALRDAPPDKTIVPMLRDPTQHARIVDTRWDAFARTDVVATDDPSQRLVFTDGGAGTYMLRWNGRIATQAPRRNDLETLPFLLGPHANVLVIGAGGGIDVVRALVAGARHVTAVELNGATVATVRAARAYNGNVLDRTGVTTVVDDGRHFLAHSHARYDTILLNLVYSGVAEGAGDALAESYIFTTQAFRLYLDHLTPHGRIGVISHQALEGLRAFTTGVEALHAQGYSYPQAMLRAGVLMTDNQTPQTRPTLTLVQAAPMGKRELDLLRARALGDLNLRPLYVPYYFRGSFDPLAEGRQTLGQFLQGSDYAIDPTDDNRPFFFDLTPGLPEGLGGALWAAALLVAGALALVIVLRNPARPSAARRQGPQNGAEPGGPPWAIWTLGAYMALLGCGFMCVEVPLIQRFILVLGEPVRALAVVLCTLLVAGGAGSLLAGRLTSSTRLLPLTPLIVALLVLVAFLLLPGAASALLSLSAGGAIVASALLVPLGLAMGMPFPLGLRLAARVLPGDVALFWAINALFSVLGAVGAAAIAVQYGFGAVLLTGAICYGLAAVALALTVTRGARGRVQSAVDGHP